MFIAYLLTLPVLVAVDLSWAGFFMKNFYQERLSTIISPTINLVPLAIFYLLFSIGVFYFVAYPAHERHSLMLAILSGALFGAVAYGTYDLVNMTTIAGWPLAVTVVDILWGGVVTAITGAAGYYFLKLFT